MHGTMASNLKRQQLITLLNCTFVPWHTHWFQFICENCRNLTTCVMYVAHAFCQWHYELDEYGHPVTVTLFTWRMILSSHSDKLHLVAFCSCSAEFSRDPCLYTYCSYGYCNQSTGDCVCSDGWVGPQCSYRDGRGWSPAHAHTTHTTHTHNSVKISSLICITFKSICHKYLCFVS